MASIKVDDPEGSRERKYKAVQKDTSMPTFENVVAPQIHSDFVFADVEILKINLLADGSENIDCTSHLDFAFRYIQFDEARESTLDICGQDVNTLIADVVEAYIKVS